MSSPERGADHRSYLASDGKSLDVDVFNGLVENYGIELVGRVDFPASEILTDPMRTLRRLSSNLALHGTFVDRLQPVFEADAGLDIPGHLGVVMRPVTVRNDHRIRELLPKEHFLSAADIAHICASVLSGKWTDLVADFSVIAMYARDVDGADAVALLSPVTDGHRVLYVLDRDQNWSEHGPLIIVPV